MNKTYFDQNNFNQQMIMAACANLVTDENFTARQVLELLDEMKGQLWSALCEIQKEEEK